MRVAAAFLLLALAGAQLARCAGAGSAAHEEADLIREVEAAAAVSGAAAEVAIPIAPAAPTFTPYVPTKAEVICMDGNAPALKLNKANCVFRYTAVYEAVGILNDQASQLSNELQAAQDTINDKTAKISDLISQIQDLEKQLAAQAKRWTAWLEGNVTQAELAVQKKANATQAALDKTGAQLKLCKADLVDAQQAKNFTAAKLDAAQADLADAQEAKAAAVAKLGAAQAELAQQQQACSKSQLATAADLTAANGKITELKRSLAECVEEADAIALVAEQWAAEIKEAQEAMQAGDCSEAVALIKASANDTQIALDECNANLIRLQASSITGEEYPVRALVPAPAPDAQPAELAEPAVAPAKAAAKPAVGRKEAVAAPAKAPEAAITKPAVGRKEAAGAQEAAAPAPAPAAASKEAAAAPATAPEAAIRKPAALNKPAVLDKQAARAPAAAPEEAAPAPLPAVGRREAVRGPAAALKDELAAAPAPAPAALPQQQAAAAPAPAPAVAEPVFQVTEARGSKKPGNRKSKDGQKKSGKKETADNPFALPY